MDQPSTGFDKFLERATKIIAILVPSIIAAASLIYTANKDKNDIAQRRVEADHRDKVDRADAEQKNIANLLPLLKSDKDSERMLGIELFTSQANREDAPLDLLPTIRRLQQATPSAPIQAAVEKATAAAARQQENACKNTLPEGVYFHVQEKGQIGPANELGAGLKQHGLIFRGVQLVDVVPRETEIRYYPAGSKPEDLDRLVDTLASHGLSARKSNISYLLKGCPAKATYEVWFAADAKIK